MSKINQQTRNFKKTKQKNRKTRRDSTEDFVITDITHPFHKEFDLQKIRVN